MLVKKGKATWHQTHMLFLSICNIPRGKGFDPKRYPAGRGTSVAIDDLEEVSIEFNP